MKERKKRSSGQVGLARYRGTHVSDSGISQPSISEPLYHNYSSNSARILNPIISICAAVTASWLGSTFGLAGLDDRAWICNGDVIQMEVSLPEWTTIHFENVSQNETFAYSLVSIRGRVRFIRCTESLLFIHRLRNGIDCDELKTHVKNNRFAVVLQLNEGRNEFRFSIDDHECCRRTFLHRPAVTEYVVMPMYIQCRTDDENVDDDSLSGATGVRDRITLGCRLLQTIVAETLQQSGFGRKTFSLAQDDPNGNECIVVFNSALRWEAVLKMNAEQLWEYLGREIMTSEYGRKNRKFLAFLSSRSKNEYSQHLAIGGGGLALCDAKYIRTWPATLDDFNSTLDSDATLVESSLSASLGAVCHELCHTFDLGHTIDGIMGRDFHRVCSLFTVPQNVDGAPKKPSANVNLNRNDSLVVCEECRRRRVNSNESFGKGEFWFGGCGTLLAYHRWINHGSGSADDEWSTNLHFDPIRCIVTSVHGIVIVQLRDSSGYVLKCWEFYELRKKKLFLVPICYVRRSSNIVIEDSKGNLLKRDIECVL